jgi:hypothetical protein
LPHGLGKETFVSDDVARCFREEEIIKNKHKPEAILRNQKIQRQPAFIATIPPSRGPMLRAVFVIEQASCELIHVLKDLASRRAITST